MKGISGREGDSLGKIVFSPNRVDGALRDEKNTQEENLLQGALKRHIIINDPVSPEEGNLLKQYIGDPVYGDFFMEPSGSEVYRGLKLRGNKEFLLKKWLGNPDQIPESGSTEGQWIMGSRESALTSYTTSLEEALRFSGYNVPAPSTADSGNKYAVIFVAKLSDNRGKFLDANTFYDSLRFFDQFKNENEAIGIGEINVCQIMWKLRGR